MIGVVDKVRNSIYSSREAIMRMIAEMQKPILDQKVDEMLKEAKKTKKVIVKYAGRGLGIGKRIGGGIRKTGMSLLKKIKNT